MATVPDVLCRVDAEPVVAAAARTWPDQLNAGPAKLNTVTTDQPVDGNGARSRDPILARAHRCPHHWASSQCFSSIAACRLPCSHACPRCVMTSQPPSGSRTMRTIRATTTTLLGCRTPLRRGGCGEAAV